MCEDTGGKTSRDRGVKCERNRGNCQGREYQLRKPIKPYTGILSYKKSNPSNAGVIIRLTANTRGDVFRRGE